MAFEYTPAVESTDGVEIRPAYGLFIDGDFRDTGTTATTISPATDSVLTEVAQAGPAEIDTAVASARRAYDEVWGPMPGRVRAKYLYRIARLIQDRTPELALLETLNNGKPIRESRTVDLPLAAAHVFSNAGWADKLQYVPRTGQFSAPRTGQLSAGGVAGGGSGDPRPLGVVAQVVSWNCPLVMLAQVLAPALACGNTVVLSPAATTPLTALAFAEICQQADLPPGVVNILTGPDGTGQRLAEHPGVDAVTVAGPSRAARSIARAVAGTAKRLTMQLGGTSATIVFDDAALDDAVEGIVDGAFANQGHSAWAGSRLLVQEPLAEDLLSRLRRRTGQLRVGDPLDWNTDLGAIHSAAHLTGIRELCAEAEAEGTERWSPPVDLPERGFWFPPTIVSGVSQAHRIVQEEVFGPVLTVQTFRTPAEAVERANNTRYGFSAGIWSEKGSRVLAVAERLRAGVIWANTVNRFDPTAPIGGYRESGLGRHGGRHGLEGYLAC